MSRDWYGRCNEPGESTSVDDTPNRTRTAVIVHRILSLASMLAFAGLAQSASAQLVVITDSNRTRQIDPDRADIFFDAKVQMDEITIYDLGAGSINFNYNQIADTVEWVDRTPIPAELLPNVTYRDRGVRLVIYGALEVDPIVARLLGETPPAPEENVRREDQER